MIKLFIKLIVPGFALSTKIYYRYKFSYILYKNKLKKISNWYMYRTYRKYGCFISNQAEIKPNIEFPHPIGIVIGAGVKIGDNCIIYQNVTLGRKNKEIQEVPEIGNNVTIYSNSTIIGNIKIGDNSIVGCNTVVMKSVEENSKCVGVVK